MTQSPLRCCTSIIPSSVLVQVSSSLSISCTRAWPRSSLSTKFYFRHGFRVLFVEINHSTMLKNKTSTAYSCAEDQILERKSRNVPASVVSLQSCLHCRRLHASLHMGGHERRHRVPATCLLSGSVPLFNGPSGIVQAPMTRR